MPQPSIPARSPLKVRRGRRRYLASLVVAFIALPALAHVDLTTAAGAAGAPT